MAAKWVLGIAGVLAVSLAGYLLYVYVTLPDIRHLADENPAMTSFIENWAEQNGLDPQAYRIENWVPYDQIAPLLVHVTVYAEDTGFYQHDGVEWEMTRDAARRFIEGRSTKGASTITQQLAKNLFLDGAISPHRKIREIMLALQMERLLSKERMLEIYLNVVEWGDRVWGIAQAAEHYFGKTPAELDPFECVFLPPLLPAPRREATGYNLYRMTGVYRRICYYLHKDEKMTLDEWVYAKRGLGPLEIALNSGRSMEEALAEARAANPPASR